MRKLVIILLLIVSVGVISCKEDEAFGDAITITLVDGQLNLLNNTENTLYYFLMDELSLAIWAPMVSESQDKLAPRGQARIKLEDVTGYSTSTNRVVLYYWQAVTVGGQQQPGTVNELFFEL